MSSRDRIRGRVLPAVEILGLALLSYLPYLLSNPGRIAADSKQALYLDPGGFLADSTHLWDAGVAAGTVSHQHVGYLWPMGPWFWFHDLIGTPVWVAQRLWFGSLVFLAALGARWLIRSLGLGRTAALAGAVAYGASPYQFVFVARASVLLLPWVGLPWLVELTRRSLDRGGWRHPALFALVAATVAGVNAPTLLLVGVGPGLVLVAAALRGPVGPAIATAGRLAVLSLVTALWWLVPLLLQARYGLDVLAVTEDLRATSSRSSPGDLLRGLGNWFFYGGDRRGPHADQAPLYDGRNLHALLSFLLPAFGLASMVLVRWRSKLLPVAFLGATVVAVGVWPYEDPSGFGAVLRWVSDRSAVGFGVGYAARPPARILAVDVLGLAIASAAFVTAAPRRARTAIGALVVVLALAALGPAFRVGMLSEAVERPSELPSHWFDAAAHLDDHRPDTRVLELPGSNFAAHRWGNAIEPILPHLMDRPHLVREVLPYGSSESALLLDALDRRLQHGVLDAASVAPVARLLGVGDILIRTDLASERFGLRSPGDTWSLLVDPVAPGLGEPVFFGAPTVDVHGGHLDPLTPRDLDPDSRSRDVALPPVTVLPVLDPEPVLRVESPDGAILVDGDADGIVDAAAAGSLDGSSLVLLSGALDDDRVRDAAESGARIVLTDSNRKRSQTWFTSIRDTRGPTERADETVIDPSGHDARLPSFAEDDVRDRTVVEQIGATVDATSGGGAARPEDRPAAAVDGRTGTSWRVGGADPVGERITIGFDEPRTVADLQLLQPQDGPRDRIVDRVRIRAGSEDPIDVALDDRSLDPPGQTIPIGSGMVDRISIEIRSTTDPGFAPELANAVGFAEIGIDGLDVIETVRLPSRLLDRIGDRSRSLPLEVVLTRLRTNRDEWTRHDEEPVLDRSFELTDERTFTVDGVLRIADRATGAEVDRLLGTDAGATVTASGRLQGAPGARPSRVLDGDPETVWVSGFGDAGPISLDLRNDSVERIDALEVVVVADERHSVPTRITAIVDDEPIGTGRLDGDPDLVDGGRATVRIPLERSVRTDRLRLRFDDLETVPASIPEPDGAPLPIAVAAVDGTGFAPVPVDGPIDRGCRTDLLTVDGRDVPIRIDGRRPDGSFGFVGCEEIDAGPGDVRVRSSDETGLDLDRVVLRSDHAAGATPSSPPVHDTEPDPTAILARETDRRGSAVEVRTDGEPFWFVSGQSAVDGWSVGVADADVGPRTVVDGYANAWLITPHGPGELRITTDWGPQRWVRAGFVLSALAVLGCLVIVFATRASPRPASDERDRPALIPFDLTRAGIRRPQLVTVAVAAVLVAFVSRWWVGIVAAATMWLVGRRTGAVWIVAVVAPVALLAAHLLRSPEIGWLAWAPVMAAAVAEWFSGREDR